MPINRKYFALRFSWDMSLLTPDKLLAQAVTLWHGKEHPDCRISSVTWLPREKDKHLKKKVGRNNSFGGSLNKMRGLHRKSNSFYRSVTIKE